MTTLETDLLELDALATAIVRAVKEYEGIMIWEEKCMREYMTIKYNDKNKFAILNKMIRRRIDNDE